MNSLSTAKDSREALFEDYPIPKAVATLSVPTVLSSLVSVFYSLADTYFVGMINDPVQTAAVTLAAPVLLAFNAVNNLFGVGSSSMMSRALGRKDYDTLRRSSAFGFYGAAICGLLFAVICTVFRPFLLKLLGADEITSAATSSYLNWTVTLGAVPAILSVVIAYMIRSEGASLHASIGTMLGCFMNILLDPVFILPWGMNLGAIGAAVATFISNCISLAYFFLYLYIRRKHTYVCVSPKMFSLRKNIVMGVCAVGVPASIQNLLNVVATTLLNILASPYGAAALAAMGICSRINHVPMFIAMGLSQGIMPLLSYTYACRNIKRMKATLWFAARFSTIFLVTMSALIFVFSGPLVHLFIDDPQTVEYGEIMLRGFCLGLPFLNLDFLAVHVFQAVGMGKESLIFAILRKVVFEIPAMLLLNTLFPLFGLAYAQLTSEFMLSMIALFVLVNFFKKLGREMAERAAKISE